VRLGALSFGETPRPAGEELDRLSMALTLLMHARHHVAFIQEHTPSIMSNNEGGRVTFFHRPAAPLPADEPLALEVETKHCVEDLMSALEYVAMEIYERVCCDDARGAEPHFHPRVSFPVPPLNAGPGVYAEKIEEKLPGLSARRRDLFDLLVSFGRYARDPEVWLDTIATAWPELKHRRLARAGKKPAKVHVQTADGMVDLPDWELYYFPGTSRAVVPNLFHAIEGIEGLSRSVAQLLSQSPPPPTTP
jgi:hypothetical protein